MKLLKIHPVQVLSNPGLRTSLGLFLVLSLLVVLTGCGSKKGTSNQPSLKNDTITVVTTSFPPYDFVREIAGDRVNLSMLLPPGSESHSWEPTPQDIIKIQKSQVFIYTGGESDTWLTNILNTMTTENRKVISLMNTVEVVEEELVEGMQEEEEDPPDIAESPEYDEHVWTSPKNAALIVKAISTVLCDADPKNAEVYRQNTVRYIAALDKLDAAFKETVAGGVRKTVVFGDRFPFRYLADAYGLSYFAAFPGCSTETEPSAATIAFLVNKVKAEAIPVVFYIELSNERMADTISEETGAKKLLLHACHNISKKDFDQGRTFMDLMNQNVINLKEALW